MLDAKLDSAALNAAISKLEKQLPVVADQVVRKLTFDGMRDIVVSLTTGSFGTIRRVDTGRYRAAWSVGGESLGFGVVGPTAGARAGDGFGKKEITFTGATYTITNAVEYAEYVEYGTRTMEAGHHVEVALQRVTEDGEDLIRALLGPLFESVNR